MSNTTIPKARPAAVNEPTPRDGNLIHQAKDQAARWMSRHSISILQVTLGLVFLGFGALKFIPGASPAEGIAVETVEVLSLGIVSGSTALIATAITETLIGLTLITGKFLRVGLVIMGGAIAGMLSTLAIFFEDMFMHGVTLEAQYVIKDFVLIAAALVVAARALGARMVVDD